MADHRFLTAAPDQRGGSMAKARRTTMRSRSGKKLYAVRDAGGRFKDIQTYERAHRADLAHKSKAELAKAAAKKKKARKTAKKKAARKKTARRA
jgi:hypothetical protein